MKLFQVSIDIGYNLLVWAKDPEEALKISRDERKGMMYIIEEVDISEPLTSGIAKTIKPSIVHEKIYLGDDDE